ncbi:MAG TPA: DUF3105 domain-containing protein [Thermoleophilaceae bacterium]|nr:DUF3105 domain-containing protein [Thermoleophilaceae bacterium]
MASRKEQKEQLRRERQEREAKAGEAARKRRLIGYAVGGGVVVLAVVVAVALLAGGGGGSSASGDVLPDDGSYPEPREVASVAAGAKAANCELKSYPAKTREHLADLSEKVKYASKPPTSGSHYQVPAEDNAYDDPPNVKELVHTLEHGRIVIWFKKSLPAEQRASLKAYYDEDPYQMVLVPDETGMTYAVAATAWNRDPQPNGTGRLLGCERFSDDVFTAIEAFKDEHRSRGPEPVP